MGEGITPTDLDRKCPGPGDQVAHDPLAHGRVADDAALADLLASGLELRLDQRADAAAVAKQIEGRWQDQPQGNEGNVGDGEVECAGKKFLGVGDEVTAR